MVLLYFIAAGLLAGLLTGRRFTRLADVRIAWAPVALLGLVLQVALFSPPVAAVVGRAGPPLYVGSTLLVLAALLRNLRQPGFWLLALGGCLNATVILANGGFMPVAPSALAALGRAAPDAYSNVTTASTGTALAWLGDVFVVPPPIPFANVVSVGDILIGLGAAWFVAAAMRHPERDVAPVADAEPRQPTSA